MTTVKEHRVYDDDGKGFYIMFESGDIEDVNPIEHYRDVFVNPRVVIEKEMLLAKKIPVPAIHIDAFLQSKASLAWGKKLKEIRNTELPNNLYDLLKASSKGEQVRLLKGISLTPEQLLTLIIFGWEKHGYRFSQYTGEHYHNGLDLEQLPKIINIKEGQVKKIGQSNLTDGQLKQIIEHRTVTISKFIDNGDEWHCFFITYRSIKGEESWKDGQPHFHYISDKFGIPRAKVVEELKSKNYKLGSLPHIDLLDYKP